MLAAELAALIASIQDLQLFHTQTFEQRVEDLETVVLGKVFEVEKLLKKFAATLVSLGNAQRVEYFVSSPNLAEVITVYHFMQAVRTSLQYTTLLISNYS